MSHDYCFGDLENMGRDLPAERVSFGGALGLLALAQIHL